MEPHLEQPIGIPIPSEFPSNRSPDRSGGLTRERIDAHAEEVLRDGFSVLRDFIPREMLLVWARAFSPFLEKQITLEGAATSRGANRYYVTLPFAAPFADPAIFENDDLLAILEKLVGKDPVFCQLATDTPVLGSDYQPIHRDTPPLFPESGIETPPFQLAVNFPLVDVTADNGPLEITRGTHRVSKEEGLRMIESGAAPIEQALMRLGDVMIRDVRGLHRGTPNPSATPRPMVVLGYSRQWLHRPEVSIQIPRAALSGLSDRARRLVRFNPIVESTDRPAGAESYTTFSY